MQKIRPIKQRNGLRPFSARGSGGHRRRSRTGPSIYIVPVWLELDAHPRHVAWLRRFVPNYFKSFGIKVSSRVCMKVTLALVESFDNVTEHAYPRSRKKPVLVGFDLRRGHLHLDVLDRGRGIPAGRRTLPSSMSEGGRGLFLIHHLANKVTSHRKDGWHHLHMRIPLGK